MGNGTTNIEGVKVNTADIKRTFSEGVRKFVELKNGIIINLNGQLDNKKEAFVKIDENNKTQIGNILGGTITGSNNADNIVISDSMISGEINLKGGDDKLTVNDSFARKVTGGDGKDKVVFNSANSNGEVTAESVVFNKGSNARGNVKGDSVIFDNYSFSTGKVEAGYVQYKNKSQKM